jgi:hypothetical protein
MIRCVFLSLVLGSTICASDRALPENDPGELGVIEGEVFDSAGSPLASACVWVRERGRPQSGVLHSVFTDEAGHFRIEKLRLGSTRYSYRQNENRLSSQNWRKWCVLLASAQNST